MRHARHACVSYIINNMLMSHVCLSCYRWLWGFGEWAYDVLNDGPDGEGEGTLDTGHWHTGAVSAPDNL